MKESMSPMPIKIDVKEEKLNFPDALREVLKGARVTKLSWEDKKTYGYLKDKLLVIHRSGDEKYKDYSWILSEEDLRGRDYIIN